MIKRTALLGTTAVLSAIIAMPASAQSFSDDEIIVTATKRQQTLQETPVTVSVTSADVIDKANILDIGDLQSVVPSLRVSQLQNSGNTSFSLRGFGNGINNVGIEPAVGVFVDGVYRSRAAAAINNLPNLERVEVLSGPQSTLFGKNASAGVVSIVTSAPSFDTQGYVEGGLANYGGYHAKSYFTGGLTDTVAVSLGAGFQAGDGYFDTTGAADYNDTKRLNVRGQLLIEPTENLSFRIIADGSSIDEVCCGTSLSIEGPIGTQFRALQYLPANGDTYAYEAFSNRDAVNKIDDLGVSVQANYDFDRFTLTSITALRNNEWFYDSDSDFSSFDVLGTVTQDVSTDTFTQELRLTSDLGGQFEFMLGGYYFKEDLSLDSKALWGADARAFAEIAADNPVLLPTIGALTGTDASTYFEEGAGTFEYFTQDDEAFSIFGTVDYMPTDRLTITAGLNYTEVEKNTSLRGELTDTFAPLDLRGAVGATIIGGGIFGDGLEIDTDGDGIDDTVAIPSFEAVTGVPFVQATFQADGVAAIGATAFTTYATNVQTTAASIAASDDNPLLGLQFLAPLLDFPNSVEDGRTSDDDLTYSLRGSYEVNDNINVYASVGTGFKASSWNLTRDTRPFDTDETAILADGIDQPNQGYGTRFAEPEESTVFEIGAKMRFERGALNVAVFDQSIKNFQSAIFNGTGFVLANAEEQSTKGIEFDSTFDVTDGLSVQFGGTLLDPLFDLYTNAQEDDFGNSVDLTGETPAGIPEVALSTAAIYTHTFANGLEGYIRGEHQYESEVKLVDNLPDSLTRTTNQVNASFGLEFENGISAQVWSRNLFGDEHATSGFPTPLVSAIEGGLGATQSISVYPNQPTTYGVNLRKTF